MGESSSLYLVAEAGATHTGLQSAKNLVDIAIEAGFDAVKFQMPDLTRINPDEMFGKHRLEDILKQRCLTNDEWEALYYYIDNKIDWFFTATTEDNVLWAQNHSLKDIKICSRDLTNHELIEQAVATGLRVHLDTGGSTMEQIEKAVSYTHGYIVIHHCPTGYPSNPENENLGRIKQIQEAFKCFTAYSSHTASLEMDCMAVALGVDMLEVPIKEVFSYSISPERSYALSKLRATHYVKTIRKCEKAL